FCLFRMLATAIMPSFVLIHFFITIQQILSTFRVSDLIQKWVAHSSLFIIYGYSTLFGIFSFRQESFSGTSYFCSSYSKDSELFIIVNMDIMMVVDVINSIATLFLWRHNKEILARDRESYDLGRSFHRRQNLYAMEQFLPVSALHSIFYIIFF
ncbi:hypothetical protein PFISCL1PPCAC_2445, partial [Pristionchus fissidentatus]